MNATVVIPTYWAGDDTQANAPGTYDHSTSLNAANPELDRCLTSLEQVRDIPRIILLVVCPVSATADVSHRVHEIVNAHPTLKVTCYQYSGFACCRPRGADCAQRFGRVREPARLRRHPQHGSACAAVLGHDAVVFLDDDETVIDADFMKRRPMHWANRRVRAADFSQERIFYDRDGSPLAPTDKVGICHRWWTKRIEFNRWMKRPSRAPASRAPITCAAACGPARPRLYARGL
ncbi:MAG: hypothetical protein ACLU0O_07335 [Collinsella sp.]